MWWNRQRMPKFSFISDSFPFTSDSPIVLPPMGPTGRTRELDAIIDDLFSALRIDRQGADFLCDPSILRGSTRDYHVYYLNWLGIDVGTLPPERVWIQANRPYPANLERSVVSSGGRTSEKFGLYIDNGLYRSRDAVKMALAHELTHLYLVLHGLQDMSPAPNGASTHLSLEEEVRTEVASILLGFGKIVLNGACAYERLYWNEGFIAQLGYLPTDEFAYVYQRVNTLADVPAAIAEHGLEPAALQALQRVKE